MAWFARFQFGWDRVALLYTSDAYGLGGSSKFIEAAANYNVSIISDQSFQLGATLDDVEGPLKRIRSSGALVILYFG